MLVTTWKVHSQSVSTYMYRELQSQPLPGYLSQLLSHIIDSIYVCIYTEQQHMLGPQI